MLFISKSLRHSSCACVRNILIIVIFVIEKIKLVSFSLFLGAFHPRPKMSFGQYVATNIFKLFKGRFGSGGEGLYKPKKTSVI